MKHSIRKMQLSLFLSIFFCLLLASPSSFAIDDGTLVDECTYMGCDGWDCIHWGRGDDQRFCWCAFCDDASAAGTVYQSGDDQYVCAPSHTGGVPRCMSFPVKIKTVDLNDKRIEGADKAVVTEILRLKSRNAATKIQNTAPTEPITTIQQSTKSSFPIFKRSEPDSR